jgi:hypothetical protein
VGVIAGHMVLMPGLALMLQPAPEALGLSTVFGAPVGGEGVRAQQAHRRGAAPGHRHRCEWLVSALASLIPPLDHFVHTVVVFIAIGLGVLAGNALVLRRRGFSRRAPATGPSR